MKMISLIFVQTNAEGPIEIETTKEKLKTRLRFEVKTFLFLDYLLVPKSLEIEKEYFGKQEANEEEDRPHLLVFAHLVSSFR